MMAHRGEEDELDAHEDGGWFCVRGFRRLWRRHEHVVGDDRHHLERDAYDEHHDGDEQLVVEELFVRHELELCQLEQQRRHGR